jgi:2-polyprenyl-3-methyl-5-hydroxy-6-metoxy-1,4-benzoquinol methylase
MNKIMKRCDYCESEENELIYEYTRFEKNNVLQCKNCGLVFLELKQSKKEIEEYYSSGKYRNNETLPKRTAEEMFDVPIVKKDCEDRLDWIQKSHGDIKGKRILELGSSSGYLLEKLYSAGAKEVVGVELTENYAKHARKLGFTVYSEPIEELGVTNEFDLIVTFHAFEHMTKPKEVLKAVHKSLKKDGMFMGEVPNQDDWRIKIFNNDVVKRFHYDPNHYFYYSPKTLSNYLNTSFKISLETVERYNSLIQLTRILNDKYDLTDIDAILKKDIITDEKNDLRLPNLNNKKEIIFNSIFEKSINEELMGNCLRWKAIKKINLGYI